MSSRIPRNAATAVLTTFMVMATLVQPSVAGAIGKSSPKVAPPSIAAKLTATKISLGEAIYAQGKVVPATATTRVVLQRKVNGKWSDRGGALVDSASGAFKIRIRPSATGVYTMRIRSNGGSVLSGTFYLKVGTAVPQYVGIVRPFTSDVDRLLAFARRHTGKVVYLDLLLGEAGGSEGFNVDPTYDSDFGWEAYIFVCSESYTTPSGGSCSGGAEILIRKLSRVPDSSLRRVGDRWRLQGRFKVPGVYGPQMGIFSLNLEAVPHV